MISKLNIINGPCCRQIELWQRTTVLSTTDNGVSQSNPITTLSPFSSVFAQFVHFRSSPLPFLPSLVFSSYMNTQFGWLAKESRVADPKGGFTKLNHSVVGHFLIKLWGFFCLNFVQIPICYIESIVACFKLQYCVSTIKPPLPFEKGLDCGYILVIPCP